MKRLLAAAALCCVAAPAQALDSAYPDPAEVRAILPTATVPVPPFYSRADRQVTAHLERELGVRSLTMLATTIKTPKFQFLTYAWQTRRISAQRLVFLDGSSEAYLRAFQKAAEGVRTIGDVTVFGRPGTTLAWRPIGARRAVFVTVVGNKPRRASAIAETVARESTRLERAQPRFVARHATAMVGWEVAMWLNDPQSTPTGDFGPSVRKQILRMVRSDRELRVSQAHYVQSTFTGNCLALTPRNGSGAEPVHLLFDDTSGGHSRVTAMGYGACP